MENQETNGQEEVINSESNQQEQEPKNDTLLALDGLIPQEDLNEIKALKQIENKEKKESAENIEKEKKPVIEEKKSEVESSEKTEKKNILGISNKKSEKKSEIVIENESQILDVVKTKFGQEVNDIKDLPKFFEAAQKWRADSQKVEDVTTKYQQLEDIVAGLPQELIESMESFYKGEDYLKVFENKSKINYSIDFEKQDLKSIVNQYFPNKFSDEDFEEEDKSQALEIAIEASKDKFNAEKQTIESQRVKVADDAVKRNDLYKSSVNGSVKNLTQSFPDIDKNELKNIQKTLEGGQNAIVSLFFNTDGSVKENAAESIMLAIHGKSVIEDMMELASHKAETKVAEELLSRGNESRNVKGGTGTEVLSEAAKRQLEELKSFEKKSTF